jgi:hypothetical protein
VQETLFIPLAARPGRPSGNTRCYATPRPPRWSSRSTTTRPSTAGRGRFVTVLRTAIIDFWVREFLAAHPAATVVELGTGLNTRFERVDNGQVHWFDLDLPDTIELRRKLLRRHRTAPDGGRVCPGRGLAASRRAEPGTVLLRRRRRARLPARRPGHGRAGADRAGSRGPDRAGHLPKQTFDQQHKLAARKGIDARWAWACDDPRSLERFGLEVRQSATLTRPPRAMRAQLPSATGISSARRSVPGKAMTLTLFRASSPAAGGRAATAREAGPD